MYSDLCDVYARSTTGQAYGSKPTYATTPLANVRCRYVEKQRRGLNSITGEWVVTTAYTLLVPNGTAVNEGDRIKNIRLHDGTIHSGDFQIDGGSVERRGRMHRHRSLRLKKVS